MKVVMRFLAGLYCVLFFNSAVWSQDMTADEGVSQLVAEGQALFEDKKFTQAAKVYSRALAKNPRCVDALFGRGICWWAMDRCDDGIRDLSAVLAIDPNHVNARNFRGECFLGKFDLDRAEKDFSEVVERNILHGRAYDGLAMISELRGNWDQAIEWHSKAIVWGEPTCERLRNRGECFCFVDKYGRALRDYTDALSLDPDDVETLRSRARLGGFEEIEGRDTNELRQMQLDDLRHILRLQPNNQEILEEYVYATVFITPNYEEALEACKRLEKIDKDIFQKDDLVLVCRGEARFRTGDIADALSDYAAAIQMPGNPFFAYWQRAELHFARGDWEMCLADCDSSIAHHPDGYEIYLLRSEANQKLGRHTKALADLTYLIDTSPNHRQIADCLRTRADVYDAMNDPTKATADRKRAAAVATDANLSMRD